MRRTIGFLAALCLFLAVGTGDLWAQNSQPREGFWIGFGFGWGSISGGCDDIVEVADVGFCDFVGESQGAFAAYLMMGGTLSPNLRLGGESYSLIGARDFAGVSGASSVTVVNNLALTLYVYPMVESGLFLKGGVGTGLYVEGDAGISWGSTGLGFLLGAGYDLRISRNTSLTPIFTFGWGGLGDLKLESIPIGEKWNHTYFSLALGFTFH